MIVEATSPLEAWRLGSNALISNGGSAYNVLVSFPATAGIDESPLSQFDPRRVLGSKFDRARDVANTIFPAKTWSNSATRNELYDRYMRAHARRNTARWGTYFERMIAFGANNVNQLERVIAALTTWRNSYRAALVMHISSADADKLRPLGAPCLQYVQFNCPDASRVDLLAVYRNHDYCNKVLGNFYGLCRLLQFVCDESDRDIGLVTSLSAHAFFNTTQANQRRLVGQ